MNFLELLFPETDSEEWVFVDKEARRRFVFGYRARRDGENRTITLDCEDAHHTFFDRMTLATISGVILGVVVGWYRRVRLLLDPFLSALYATPRIAMIPLTGYRDVSRPVAFPTSQSPLAKPITTNDLFVLLVVP